MLKKLTALALTLCLLCSAACAASIAVNFEGSAVLIDENGAEKLAPGAYDFIFALDSQGSLFYGGHNDSGNCLYALIDAEGNALTEQAYDMFTLEGDTVLFMQDGLYGAMTTSGEVMVKPVYTQLVCNGEGGFLALTTDCYDDEQDGLYCVDRQGKATATGVMTLGALSWFTDGMMPLLSAGNNLYGYVDVDGQWAVRPQFSFAGSFLNGRAVASLSTGYGLIDRTGNWVLTPKYAYFSYDDESMALAMQNDIAIAFDPQTCAELFRVEGENLSAAACGKFMQVFGMESVCLYNRDGALLSEASASAYYYMGEQGQIVLTDGDWGTDCCYLLNADGQVVAGPYQSLFALYTRAGKGYYGFMTFDVTVSYDKELEKDVYTWDENRVRLGIIDETGAQMLPAEYEVLYAISEGFIYAQRGADVGVIDETGAWLYRVSTVRD